VLVVPSGECLRGYKPRVVDCGHLVRRVAASCWLNPAVIPGLHAGTCAVLHGSSLIVLIMQVRLTFVK